VGKKDKNNHGIIMNKRRESVSGQVKRPSFHPVGTLGTRIYARFATTGCSALQNAHRFVSWSIANHPHDRSFAVWSIASPPSDRRFAPLGCRTGQTTVVVGCRAAFWGEKSIFQASFLEVKGLAGLKSGWQAAGCCLPFFQLYKP
jgi:hypothetical protein